MPGFAPILGLKAEVLILGSMPSQISLSQHQYYANPRNAFWWIMSEIYNFTPSLSYAQKTQALSNRAVAVWDVLHDCERPGSLDSAIVNGSERVNDFDHFVSQHPELRLIVFNGATAEKIFRRYYSKFLTNTCAAIKSQRCPSTSPAHASISVEAKLDAWRHALN